MNEEEARAIWLRAAELQAEAAQRHEREARRLGAGDNPEGEDTTDALTVDAVRIAAVEAGIAAEFVDAALSEASVSGGATRTLTGWKDRAATRQLGSDARRIDASRSVEAPPARVVEAMQRILPHPPYTLTLHDARGEDPLDGGLLVFRVPRITANYTPFTYTMAQLKVEKIGFSLRPSEDGRSTHLSISTSLAESRRSNWIASNVISGASVGAGGLAGLGIAKATAIAGLAVAAPIAGGALALGALGAWGMWATYRSALRKGRTYFDEMLGAIAMDCRMGPGFFPSRSDASPAGGEGPDPGDLSALGL